MPEHTNEPSAPITAADIYESMTADHQVEPVQTEPDVTEQIEDEPSEEEAQIEAEQEDDRAEDEVEEGTEPTAEVDDEESPQLDPTLSQAVKGNAKAEQRLNEITKGLYKLKQRSTKLNDELEATRPKAAIYDQWDAALANPDHVAPTIKQLVEHAAKVHGLSVDALLKKASLTKAEKVYNDFGAEVPEWEQEGFASETEKVLKSEMDSLRAELASLKGTSEQLQKEREESRKRAEEKNYVEGIAPKVIATLAKSESGWKVTKAMIEKALSEFPQRFKEDPVKAVKSCFPDELAAHKSRAVAESRKQRGPEALPQSTGKGKTVKPASQWTAADAYAAILEG